MGEPTVALEEALGRLESDAAPTFKQMAHGRLPDQWLKRSDVLFGQCPTMGCKRSCWPTLALLPHWSRWSGIANWTSALESRAGVGAAGRPAAVRDVNEFGLHSEDRAICLRWRL